MKFLVVFAFVFFDFLLLFFTNRFSGTICEYNNKKNLNITTTSSHHFELNAYIMQKQKQVFFYRKHKHFTHKKYGCKIKVDLRLYPLSLSIIS